MRVIVFLLGRDAWLSCSDFRKDPGTGTPGEARK
jgi:hypothetical protein